MTEVPHGEWEQYQEWERGRAGGDLPAGSAAVILVAAVMATNQRPRRWRRRVSPVAFVPIAREVVASLLLLPAGRELARRVLDEDPLDTGV